MTLLDFRTLIRLRLHGKAFNATLSVHWDKHWVEEHSENPEIRVSPHCVLRVTNGSRRPGQLLLMLHSWFGFMTANIGLRQNGYLTTMTVLEWQAQRSFASVGTMKTRGTSCLICRPSKMKWQESRGPDRERRTDEKKRDSYPVFISYFSRHPHFAGLPICGWTDGLSGREEREREIFGRHHDLWNTFVPGD